MTTNVTISTNHVMSPRKLRVRSVDPKDETKVWREILITPEDVRDRGIPTGVPPQGAGPRVPADVPVVTLETLYVHDGSKLIIEEVD